MSTSRVALKRIALEFVRGDEKLLNQIGMDRFMITRLGKRSIRRQEGYVFWQVVERNGVEYLQKYWYLENQRRYVVIYHREFIRKFAPPFELGPWTSQCTMWPGHTEDTRIENEWRDLNLQALNHELSEAQIAIEEQGHFTRSGKSFRK
jgi:hypothetical protein